MTSASPSFARQSSTFPAPAAAMSDADTMGSKARTRIARPETWRASVRPTRPKPMMRSVRPRNSNGSDAVAGLPVALPHGAVEGRAALGDRQHQVEAHARPPSRHWRRSRGRAGCRGRSARRPARCRSRRHGGRRPSGGGALTSASRGSVAVRMMRASAVGRSLTNVSGSPSGISSTTMSGRAARTAMPASWMRPERRTRAID